MRVFRITVGKNKKPTVPKKRATVCINNVKSCNALLRILPVCIHSCLKSVLKYKFLILHTCHLNILYLREQGYEGSNGYVVNNTTIVY